MSHRTVIINAIKAVFQDPEVRSELTTTQLAKVDRICAQPGEPCDDDYRYLSRMQTRAYCEED
jgi:hypothetical protein